MYPHRVFSFYISQIRSQSEPCSRDPPSPTPLTRTTLNNLSPLAYRNRPPSLSCVHPQQEPAETAADFRGRMAAIASATRLCLTTNSTNISSTTFIMATPPHPIPTVTTPLVPRRRHPSPAFVSINSPLGWSTPGRRPEAEGEAEEEEVGGRVGGWDQRGEQAEYRRGSTGGGDDVGAMAVGGVLEPSKRTAPRGGRLWPDFDNLGCVVFVLLYFFCSGGVEGGRVDG